MPYRVMQELWNKADGLTSRSDDRRLLRWWVPWDAQVVLLYVMLFLGTSEPSIDRSIVLHVVAIFSELLFVLCTLPAITLVHAMTQRLTITVTVPATEVSGPPFPVRVDLDGDGFR